MKTNRAKTRLSLLVTAILITACTGCQPKERDETLVKNARVPIAAHSGENGPSLPDESEASPPRVDEVPDAVPDEQPAAAGLPAPENSADAQITQQETDSEEKPAPADRHQETQVVVSTAETTVKDGEETPAGTEPREETVVVQSTDDDPMIVPESAASAEALVERSATEEVFTNGLDQNDALGFVMVGQRIYNAYEELLSTYVDKHGNVDYATLRRRRGELYGIIRDLDDLDPREYLPWDRNEKIAFWLNAYNIFTLKVVIDNYPIEPTWTKVMLSYPRNSIIHVRDAWTKKYFKVAGVEWTLREIEREKLVKQYGDLRVCLALSYASMGGAILRNEPYHPDRLDEQLEDQARKFLSNPRGFEISGRTVYLADIFNWYRQDFIAKYGDVRKFREKPQHVQAYLNFIVDYVRPADVRYLETQDYTVEFRKYDWRLNEQSQR